MMMLASHRPQLRAPVAQPILPCRHRTLRYERPAVAMRLLHSDGGTSVYMLYVWNIRCHRPRASVCL